ncbi:MAG: sulfite exporter TauE/SafE family protein [Gammaproteobacteria bacterium]
MNFDYTIAGFTVGFIIGLTGVGGGSLMTPILVLLFGIKPAIAVGTDLLYAAVTKGGGVFVHQRRGTVDWEIVGLLGCGSIPATIVALFLLQHPERVGIDYDRLITVMLSIALILTSSVLLFKSTLQKLSRSEQFDAIRALHRRAQRPMTVAAGAAIGFLVTLSSVGAGALGAAILFFLYPRHRPITIVGTDLAHAVPITLIAGLGHAHLGTVNFTLLASLLVGSLPGIYLALRALLLFSIGLRMGI